MEKFYPRPQLRRKSYMSLNGEWDYVIEGKKTNKRGQIEVPFSPEASLSGVSHILKEDETLLYHKHVVFNGDFDPEKERLILHFGAVDYVASLSIDGKTVLNHRGGYLPFECIVDRKEFDISLSVKDPTDSYSQSRGKQRLKRGNIWYTPQSGIWQEVWLEKVPTNYIKRLKIDPDLSGFNLLVITDTPTVEDAKLEIAGSVYEIKTNMSVRINIDFPHLWSPEDPYLYDFKIKTESDEIESYVGLRTFSVDRDENGIKRLFLNGKSYFHHGVLDQGYYDGGLYTPPNEETMERDILLVKSLGFNTIRKHIKIESLTWYYLCDKYGLLVWQDMVSGGDKYKRAVIQLPLITGSYLKDSHYSLFGRKNKETRDEWEGEALETVSHLYNVTSISMWCLFNEGWGQFDSERIISEVLMLDSSRIIDHASGWHDQRIGEVKSIHNYFRKYKFKKDRLDRAVILSEFGGYGESDDKSFSYKAFKTKEELTDAILRLYREEIIPAKKMGLSASIYTQLSDVEDEKNGLITYDRKEVKVSISKIREVSEELLRD